jgi:hypothetical protein
MSEDAKPYTREELEALESCSICGGDGWFHDGGFPKSPRKRVPCWCCRLRVTARAGLEDRDVLKKLLPILEGDENGVPYFRRVQAAWRLLVDHLRAK